MGKLQMNIGATAVSQNRINLPLRICGKGFNFGALGDETFEATIATVDRIGLQQLIRILKGSAVADPRIDKAGQQA